MCDWLTQRPKKKRKKNVKKKKVTAVMFAWCASSTNKRETILLVYNRCLPTATIPHHHQFYGEGVWRRHLSSTRHEKIERKREMDGGTQTEKRVRKKKKERNLVNSHNDCFAICLLCIYKQRCQFTAHIEAVFFFSSIFSSQHSLALFILWHPLSWVNTLAFYTSRAGR